MSVFLYQSFEKDFTFIVFNFGVFYIECDQSQNPSKRWFIDELLVQDGAVEGQTRISSCKSTKIATSCWTTGGCWNPPKKIPQIKRQRRSHSEMVDEYAPNGGIRENLWLPVQDGGIQRSSLISSHESIKITTSCWTTINRMLESTKKRYSHVQRLRRSPSKTVGGT